MHLDLYYRVGRVQNVVDGDTFDADVDLGFYTSTRQRFRLKGIDAPEMTGASRVLGEKSKQALQDLILFHKVIIKSEKTDSFGRYLADVYVIVDGQEIDVVQHLLALGMGVRM